MKTLLASILALALVSSAIADTPSQIAADYREKAAAALSKVNDTLEKATVPLVAALVKAGDTEGASLLQEQLKAKIAGEPVLKPQSSAVALFKLYDTARAKALEPAQKAAISRIDAMLATSEGKKLDVVAELGKVREEVEAGKSTSRADPSKVVVSTLWDYYSDPNKTQVVGKFIWNTDGTVDLRGPTNGSTLGTWEATSNPNVFKVTLGTGAKQEQCELRISGKTAELKRPIGPRYLTSK